MTFGRSGRRVPWMAPGIVALALGLPSGAGGAAPPTFKVGPGPTAMTAEEKEMKADPAAGMQHGVILVEETERDDPIEGYARTAYHLRAKILSNEARALGDVVIPMESKRGYLKEWWGRTIQPDGTVLEVNKDDLKEQTIVKIGGAELRIRKAALPGVAAGCVVDYGYVFQDRSFEWEHDIVLQREWPIRLFRYRWLPAQDLPSQYFVSKRPGVDIKVTAEKQGIVVEGRDLPPVADEPYMPPAATVRAGVTLYYSGFYHDKASTDPNAFWSEVARREESDVKSFIRKDDVLKAAIAAMKLPEGAALVDKLHAAYDWLASNVKNRLLLTSEEEEEEDSDEEVQVKQHDRTCEDVLKEKVGSSREIDDLFIGVARALGAEALVVRAPNRNSRYWDRNLLSTGQLSTRLIRIKAPADPDEKAFYVDPGFGYPFGVISWQAAPSKALLAAPDGAREIVLRGSDARQNLLETKVTIGFGDDETSAQVRWSSQGTGQRHFVDRWALRRRTPEKRKDRLRDLCGVSGKFEVSKSEAPALDDPLGKYRIECEGDLTTTGIDPGRPESMFRIDGPWLEEVPVLTAATRAFPIVFDYPWSDLVTLDIASPPGFVTAEPPQPIRIDSPFGSYALKVTVTPTGYHAERSFSITIATLKQEANEPLRKFLEDVRVADRTEIAFRKAGGGAK